MTGPHTITIVASTVALLVGSVAGYQLNGMVRSSRIAALEAEIARLKEAAWQPSQLDVPSDEAASAALAKSGRSIRISECKPRQAVPGVTCTGIITTTSGSFAGSEQPGALSFTKIDGIWTQIQ